MKTVYYWTVFIMGLIASITVLTFGIIKDTQGMIIGGVLSLIGTTMLGISLIIGKNSNNRDNRDNRDNPDISKAKETINPIV